MLGDLESRIAAVVADRLAARNHLTVGQTTPAEPQAGRGTVTVTLVSAHPGDGFVPTGRISGGTASAPRSRRVLPVKFEGRIEFVARAQDESPAHRDSAHVRCLEDLSIVAHALADPALRSGAGLAGAAADPGYRVLGFGLGETRLVGASPGALGASLGFWGEAEVWPVGLERDEGVIANADAALVPLPILIEVARATLPPGAATRIVVPTGTLRRLNDRASGARTTAQLAVSVAAEVALVSRGTIVGGVAAPSDTGLSLVAIVGETATFEYRAPAADPGPAGRSEAVMVHLAAADGTRGLFLGSVAIRLVKAP